MIAALGDLQRLPITFAAHPIRAPIALIACNVGVRLLGCAAVPSHGQSAAPDLERLARAAAPIPWMDAAGAKNQKIADQPRAPGNLSPSSDTIAVLTPRSGSLGVARDRYAPAVVRVTADLAGRR